MDSAQSVPKYPKYGNCLSGRIILITGATSGIGRAVAAACARHQARLILLGRNSKKLEHTAQQIEADCAAEVMLYPLNLARAREEHYWEMSEVLATHYGQLDGVVHNAATLDTLTPIRHFHLDSWQNTLQTNLSAPLMITRCCLPLLEKSTSPSIVWTTSAVAGRVEPFWGAYAVSKCAVDYLMKLIAAEYQNDPLRCNAISPGAVATKMRARAYPSENADTLTQPQDIVDAWLYLLGDDSCHVSGAILTPTSSSATRENP